MAMFPGTPGQKNPSFRPGRNGAAVGFQGLSEKVGEAGHVVDLPFEITADFDAVWAFRAAR